MKLFKREEGQSILIVAFALIALVALLALVVDAGNAYVQERQFSNAIDAGSQAGAIGVAQNKTDGQIAASITQYLNSNGVTTSGANANGSVTFYYVVQDSHGAKIVDTAHPIGTNGTNNVVTQTLVAGAWDPVVGVQLQGNKTFPTYIAGIVGWRQMQVGGAASSFGTCGAKNASNLFPIALANTTFVDINHNGVGDINDMTLGNDYQIYEQTTGSQLAKFGYVTWNNDTSTGTLDARIGDLNSGLLTAGDSIKSVSDSMHNDSVILNTFNSLQSSGTAVSIPVYDTYTSGVYHIVGFARVKITSVHDSSTASDRYIKVKFQIWVDPDGNGGAPDYGTCSVKTSQPPTSPVLKVTVYYRPVYPNQTSKTFYHADVVNVLDISGSMSDSFGSKSKLQAAKDALTSFNSNLQTGDQTSLVTFPRLSSGSSYNYSCTQSGSYSTYYFATQVDSLTGNFAHVNSDISGLSANGGTPLAAGLQQGLATVTGSGHNTDNISVIILASDGLANIRLDGKWTGFQGNAYTSPSCNAGAVKDATDQANLAKADPDNNGIPQAIIYAIAVGNDFNPDVLQAIASLDTNPAKPHYFRATDAASMASIYDQISSQVKTIGSDSCYPTFGIAPVPARGASVTIQAPDGTTSAATANAAGEVLVTNPQPGTYHFLAASYSDGSGITYSTLSDGFGGADYTGNPPLQVGNEPITYPTDLYLKNTTQITCSGH